MFPARIAIAKAIEDASPASGGTCQTFDAKLKLFAPAALGSSSVALNEITSQVFEVTHVGSNTISEGEEVIVGQTIDERWIVLPSAPGSSGHARFQFVTTQRIVNRQVQVKVLRNPTNAPNLAAGGILQPGDTVTINDPFNLWADIMPNATGWAYLATAQADDPSTTNDEQHVARYEIEECSLTTNEVKGSVKECLFAETNAVNVVVNFDSATLVSPQNLISAYPNVDEIPEVQQGSVSESGESYDFINAYNPNNLDAVQGTFVTLQRVTNREFSDPENYLCPKSRSTTDERWNIIQVEKQFARIIRVIYSGDSWIYNNYKADGYLPEDGLTSAPFAQCTISIEAVGEWVCEPVEGAIGWAIWKGRDAPDYQVVATDKDLRGDPPETTQVVQALAFDGCDLNSIYRSAKVFICDEEGPQLSSTSINAVPKTVLTAGKLHIAGEDCGQCKWRAEKTTRTLTYNWDGDSWELLNDEACPAGGTLTPDPATQPAPDNDNDTLEVKCETYEWVQYEFCYTNGSSSCDCPTGPSADPTEGATYSGDCTGSYDDSVQLCWTYSTETIYTLPCGSPVTGGDSSCIPLTDCPDETP
jgi:hypothetical protein